MIGIERVADLCSEHREQQARLYTKSRQFYGIMSYLLRSRAGDSVLANYAVDQTSIYSEYFLQSTCVSGVKFHPKVCKSEHASAVPRSRKLRNSGKKSGHGFSAGRT